MSLCLPYFRLSSQIVQIIRRFMVPAGAAPTGSACECRKPAPPGQMLCRSWLTRPVVGCRMGRSWLVRR